MKKRLKRKIKAPHSQNQKVYWKNKANFRKSQMLVKLYTIRTYAHFDTWGHETKQSQTKPISPDSPLPALRKTSLTSCLTRTYATTPKSQKQSQTKPISPPGRPLEARQILLWQAFFLAPPPRPCYQMASSCSQCSHRNHGPAYTVVIEPAHSCRSRQRPCSLSSPASRTERHKR